MPLLSPSADLIPCRVEPAWRPWVLVGAAMLVALGTLAGCGAARMELAEKNIKTLRDEMAELRRGQASQRVQFDGFRNRLVVLQDKLESERLTEIRRSAAMNRSANARSYDGGAPLGMPGLERVFVPAVAPSPPPAGPPKTITIGPDGVPEVAVVPDAASKSGAVDKKSRAVAGKASGKSKNARGAVPAGPRVTNRPPHDGQTDEDKAAGEYRVAKDMLDAGRIKEARSGFTRFLREHPSHALADNAQYWTGETWYAQAMWLKAARAFGEVVGRFPQGNKVPDAMFKTGLCYRKVGENKLAIDVFEQLRGHYPGTSSARLAVAQLKDMGVAP